MDQTTQLITAARHQTLDIFAMQPGKDRRWLILANIGKWQALMPGLPVNRRYQLSTQDPDVRYLMRKGRIRQVRQGQPRCRQTYLQLV